MAEDQLVAGGLPRSLGAMAPVTAEFPEASEPVTRSLAVDTPIADLALVGPADLPRLAYIVDSSLKDSMAVADSVPVLPVYWSKSRMSYTTGMALPQLRRDLEQGFARESITVEDSRGQGSNIYECQCYAGQSLHSFSVHLYRDGCQHYVELNHLDGCRFAFSSVLYSLTSQLRSCAAPLGRKPRAGAGPCGDLAVPPALQRSWVVGVAEQERSMNALVGLVEAEDEAAQVQGLQALASAPARELFFDARSSATRVAALALAQVASEEPARQLPAVDAVAGAAQLPGASAGWARKAMDVVAEAVEETENPHVRREGLRAVQALAKRGAPFPKRLVDVVESESRETMDLPCQHLARGLLQACQA